METTMQAEAQTTERSGSPVVSMIEALGQRAENLRALPAGEVDAFNRDVEALHASLKRISDDLKASFHICPHLGQRVISEKARRDLFRDLESDEQLLEKIRGKLMALCECLLETEEVLKVLPELTAMRSALDAISDAGRRRTARNHLDNCRDLQEDLLEWKKSARRGLEKIIESGLPETFDIDLSLPGQEPDASPPRASSRKRRAAAGPSRRASPPDCGGREARSAPYRRNRAEEPREPESAPAPLPRRSEDAAARVDSDPLRSRVRDYLNRWSAWHPLAPSRLGDRVQIARPATETLKVLRICALWGERRIENASSQTRVEGESDTRLWDLPCSPPPAFRTGREKRRPTPPQGVLVACPSCSEQADPACPRCGGRGMILAAGVVETTYRSADLIEASGGRALPRWLARSTEGSRLFWDFLSEPALHRDDAARKKSVNAVAEHFGPEVEKRVASEIFSESTATAGAPGERRLIRMSIEIISLPATAFECRLLDAGPGARGAEISVWMVGSGRRLRACGVPRVWTWKAAGWIAGLAACGVPLGMALVKALALFL